MKVVRSNVPSTIVSTELPKCDCSSGDCKEGRERERSLACSIRTGVQSFSTLRSSSMTSSGLLPIFTICQTQNLSLPRVFFHPLSRPSRRLASASSPAFIFLLSFPFSSFRQRLPERERERERLAKRLLHRF